MVVSQEEHLRELSKGYRFDWKDPSHSVFTPKRGLSEAVARYLFKLMAYKDEYEVARLYTDTSFVEQVKSTFDGDNLRFEFHLAPPLLARRDPLTGEPKKMSFGPWMLKAFGVLAKFKFLRGTPLKPPARFS